MTDPTGATAPAVARLQVVALGCPDPAALAAFYSVTRPGVPRSGAVRHRPACPA